MKANEIKQGGLYLARISGNYVTVRVDGIEDITFPAGRRRGYPAFHCFNLVTNRKVAFRSAQKLRKEVKPCPNCGLGAGAGCRCRSSERAMAATDVRRIFDAKDRAEEEQRQERKDGHYRDENF